jgi:hypothetical protein
MNKREKFLATVFLGGAVVWGAWEGIGRLYAWQKKLDSRERVLAERKNAVAILSESKDMWKARADWMTSNLPVMPAGEAATTLLETMEGLADQAGVSITEKALMDMEPESDAHRAGAKVKFEGDFSQVMQWIYALQRPDLFISSPLFTMSADQEQVGNIRGELVLVQWFTPQ